MKDPSLSWQARVGAEGEALSAREPRGPSGATLTEGAHLLAVGLDMPSTFDRLKAAALKQDKAPPSR
ncbi:hypothetical protein AOLI_G00021540 [Acnodon oligacanthus]